MSSRRNNLIVLALVVVLLGVAAYFIYIDQPVSESTQLGFYQVIASDPSLTEPPQVVAADEVQAAREDITENLEGDDAYEEGETKILFSETPALRGDGIEVTGYIVNKEPDLTGDALKQNGANVEFDQTTGKRIVSLELTAEGGRQMGDLTQRMVNDSLASGEPARLAIALDQDIQSAPTVQEPLGQNISISNDGLPN